MRRVSVRPFLELLEAREVLSVYNVGPGQAYATIGAVPWNNLQPGDQVDIHWQSTPYHEKISLEASGTAAQHIQIIGIPGPQGQLPIIDGDSATTSPNAPQYSYTPIQDQGVVVIYPGSDKPYGYIPSYIDIENLQIEGGDSTNTYTASDGSTRNYSVNGSGIWVGRGADITIEGCTITDNGNGLFVTSKGSPQTTSSNILVDGNDIYGNGVAGSYLQHNIYTEALGVTFEYNYLGPLRAGAEGNNLKDRSAGTVIRYNYIQDGGHLLDLVDAEDGGTVLTQSPSYLETYVYGNVFVSDSNGPGDLIHYGGDSGDTANYRNGTLYFYDNTVVNEANESDRYRTNVFELDTNQQTVDAQNNIFYNTTVTPGNAGSLFEFATEQGNLNFGVNWVSPGWLNSESQELGSSYDGTITGTSNFVVDPNNNPGFANLATFDVHLTNSSSLAVGTGSPLLAAEAAYPVSEEYVYQQQSQARPNINDLGAFAYGGTSTGNTTASSLGVTTSTSTTTAGTVLSVTVTAENVSGNTATGYMGTIHFTSSDAQAGLPSNYTFTAADDGVHTFSVTLKTAGSDSITATDTASASVTGSAAETVTPAAASTFSVSAPTTATAGSGFTMTVTAKDAYGNVATGYRGTVSFTSNDSQAVLPANYTFTSTDNGVHAFNVTLKTAGSDTVRATDTSTSSITGSAPVTVSAAAATLGMSTSVNTTTAGTAFTVTVTAKDAYGNTLTGYRDTVHFTSTDSQAVLPANYTFTAADDGVHTFTITLKTAGSDGITVVDTATSSVTGSASVTITPAAAATFALSAPTTSTAGNSFAIVVTAKDAYGNVATGYRGTVNLTSTDSQAVLPANYTFTSTDNGAHTFNVTLKTAGSDTVKITDTATSSITGSAPVTVSAAAASSLSVSMAATSITAGTPFSITVTAKDAYGNVATGFVNPVSFTSSDSLAVLPAAYTYTSADAGVHSFSITLNTAGTQSITITDPGTTVLSTTLSGITVNPKPTNSNDLATQGTAYRWWDLTSPTSTYHQTKTPGLNDSNLNTSIVLSGTGVDGVGSDAPNAYEGAGVIWSSAQTINKVTFTNGSFSSSGDGVFDANFGLQFTTDGKTWKTASWTLTPSYSYDSSFAAGVTYTFTGSATSVLGFRVVGQVRTANNSSWYDRATEVQAFGPVSSTSASTAATSVSNRVKSTAMTSSSVSSAGTAGTANTLQSASVLLSDSKNKITPVLTSVASAAGSSDASSTSETQFGSISTDAVALGSGYSVSPSIVASDSTSHHRMHSVQVSTDNLNNVLDPTV